MRNLLSVGSAQLVVALVYSASASASPVPAIPTVAAGEIGMLSLVSLGLAGAIWLARRKQ